MCKMTNMEKIIEQGFFYNLFGEKCHITCVNDDFVVFKKWRNNSWLYIAESIDDFMIHTELSNNYRAERKKKK